MMLSIDSERCIRCGRCVKVCPSLVFGQPAAQHMPCLCDSRMQAARLLPECVLSLPMHPCLTADQQETITDEIERYFHDNS